LCLPLCVGFILRYWVENMGLTRDTFGYYEQVYSLVRFSIQGFVVGMGFVIILEWALIVGDRQRVMQRFGTIVDPRLVNDILHSPKGHSKRLESITVLFADLRSFTRMCEVFDPDLVTNALNEYLNVVTTAVQSQGGVVDKFVGDAVMALWGVPKKGAFDSISAVRAAVDIRIGLAALNERRLAAGLFTLKFGIGLHCGPAIFGAIGNGVRVDHTVIGPTINVASRLQGLTKANECDILFSDEVYQEVKDFALVEKLGLSEIMGMSKKFRVVKLIGIQMADESFAIGCKILEGATHERRAGILSHSPPNVFPQNYVEQTTPKIQLPESDQTSIRVA
ncbi:MAG: adenylate/guanylate cyclase domain-containing protein, partial [Proteobacteria bacterium]|nr:adenylate/guanylate cyclase domain-containing protein [Pseudomonadota bacterium]